jgi:hypothetical protein
MIPYIDSTKPSPLPIHIMEPYYDMKSNNDSIYVSSNKKHVSIWKHYRVKGYNIISSWIDLEISLDIIDVGKLWPIWIEEAKMSRFLIFYSSRDDKNHSGSLIEIGACLSTGGIILHVGNSPTMLTGNGKLADFTYMPNWYRVSDLEKAFEITKNIELLKSLK